MTLIRNDAFYRFVELKDPKAWKEKIESEGNLARIFGSILVSCEGINASIAGEPDCLNQFETWLFSQPEFAGTEAKVSWSERIPFKHWVVKLKREIIRVDDPEIKPTVKTGKRLEASEFKKWYDEKRPMIVVDTRNDYEVDYGKFQGALDWRIRHFKDFAKFLKAHQNELKGAPIVMYCTGGIRCEKATAIALKEGIENVYQLEGGILKYFEQAGGAHYDGSCFVFDERVALKPDLKPI